MKIGFRLGFISCFIIHEYLCTNPVRRHFSFYLIAQVSDLCYVLFHFVCWFTFIIYVYTLMFAQQQCEPIHTWAIDAAWFHDFHPFGCLCVLCFKIEASKPHNAWRHWRQIFHSHRRFFSVVSIQIFILFFLSLFGLMKLTKVDRLFGWWTITNNRMDTS